MKKIIALIFGGESAEHEVSLRSAKNVAVALDKESFEYLLVGISKEGTWYQFKDLSIFDSITEITDNNISTSAEPVAIITHKGQPALFSLRLQKTQPLDCAFPIMHGTLGEDGCIQGLFKMMHLPFVGCGVLASAAGMDKEVMKRLLIEAQIPNARYELLTPQEPQNFANLSRKLGLPFFIKPANAGSSVGVHKIKSQQDFAAGLKDAFIYDHKVLAEEFIDGREVECSVMGLNHSPKASLPGEIIPQHDFYSYEAKYLDDNGAILKIPADLDSQLTQKVQALATKTYQVMGCDGLTRVDFFVKKNGEVFVNEINTIPGFTKISMYPKMWEASGISYKDLITHLINFAFQKYELEASLSKNYSDPKTQPAQN